MQKQPRQFKTMKIRLLAAKPNLLKRLIMKFCLGTAPLLLWCCRQTVKTADLFNSSLKRISFTKRFPEGLPLSIQK